MWFQNRRAKFRRNERSALSQSKPIYSSTSGAGGGCSSTSASLMSGNASSSTSSGIDNLSSMGTPGDSDQSKSIEQPVLPKSIGQIGGKI